MKTRDGIEFIPGVTLYEPFRRAGDSWYIAKYDQTHLRMEYWREYSSRCFFYWSNAVEEVIKRLEADREEADRRTRHRIGLWREAQHNESQRFNCVEC